MNFTKWYIKQEAAKLEENRKAAKHFFTKEVKEQVVKGIKEFILLKDTPRLYLYADIVACDGGSTIVLNVTDNPSEAKVAEKDRSSSARLAEFKISSMRDDAYAVRSNLNEMFKRRMKMQFPISQESLQVFDIAARKIVEIV